MENPAVTQGSKLLKALGNKKRLEVMYILREGEQKVGDLEKNHRSQPVRSVAASGGSAVGRHRRYQAAGAGHLLFG